MCLRPRISKLALTESQEILTELSFELLLISFHEVGSITNVVEDPSRLCD